MQKNIQLLLYLAELKNQRFIAYLSYMWQHLFGKCLTIVV